MLSPEFQNLTTEQQLNRAKSRMNQAIYNHIHSTYGMKKELENVSDITQLDTRDSLNPFILDKQKEAGQLVSDVVFRIEKVIYYANSYDSGFTHSPIQAGGVDAGVLKYVASTSDISKMRQSYEQFKSEFSKLENLVKQMPEYVQYFGKTEQRKIDEIESYLNNYTAEWYKKYYKPNYITNKTKEQILKDNTELDKIIKNITGLNQVERVPLMKSGLFVIYNDLEDILYTVDAISKQIYNNGINPLSNTGLSNTSNPFMDPTFQENKKLYGNGFYDIPSKYK